MVNWRLKNCKQLPRKATALIVMLSVCLAGLPIPIGRIERTAKDHSEPFPCQHCPCGCKTAEQCWRSCCCHTNAEKIAWAEKNGVTPPDFVFVAAKRELVAVKCLKATQSSTCAHCVVAQLEFSPTSSPSSVVAAGESIAVQGDDFAGSSESATVLSIFALKCQGHVSDFCHLPYVVLWPTLLVGNQVQPTGWHFALASPRVARVFFPPDDPPPRIDVLG